jgi:sortase A
MRAWRIVRSLFLVTAIACLGYTGWVYFDEYWHQRQTSEALDEAREAQPPVKAKRPAPPEGPMRARLRIPRLRLTTMVEEGVSNSTLRRSAGHIPGTALPGRPGNVGVAAHRDTHFRSLSGIRKRDRIVLSTVTRDYKYEVISTKIVSPKDVSVLAPSKGQNTLTLVTCYPFYYVGHAPKRFIVRARQIGL